MRIINHSKESFVRTGSILAALMLAISAMADQIIILAKPPTSGGYNSCPTWCENAPTADWSGSGSSSHSSAPGDNATGCTFAYTNNGGAPSISIQPTLGYADPTTCYQVDITHISGNASPNIVVGITVSGATLVSTPGGNVPVTQTLGFNSTNGINTWFTVGYLTNLTTTTPTVTFTYISGTLAATGGRFYTDGYRFTELTPCENTPQIETVNGPLAAGQMFVNVPNISPNATNVTVYADDGHTQTIIGSTNVSGVTKAIVPTSALIKDQFITATQTVNGQESCLLPMGTGAVVGGGANSPLGLGFCLNMAQDKTLTGPIGTNGNSGSSDLYFLGASGRMGGFGTAPYVATVIYPSTCWQTVYIDPTTADYLHWTSDISISPDTNRFAQLDAIAIAIQDMDTGPYDIYIDDFRNGDTLIENWNEGTNGQPALGFSQPSFSSTTSGFLLAPPPGAISPNISAVTTSHADSGNSLHVSWQFVSTLPVNWVRLNAANHPELDLTQPISFRVLMLPVGVTNGDMQVSSIPDQTQYIGGSATFSVSATGVEPFTYQWSFNDTNIIDGATNSTYTISGLTTDNAGHYTVAVSDANSCTNYSSAKLSVSQSIPRVNIGIAYDGTHVTLNWPGSHTLQSAPTAAGPYTDVSPAVVTGPYQVTPTGNAMFFRLKN